MKSPEDGAEPRKNFHIFAELMIVKQGRTFQLNLSHFLVNYM